MPKFVLASASPRRQELLKCINLDFEVIVSNADEKITPNVSPELIVQELSLLKSTSIVKKAGKNRIIIGADTIVVFEKDILGKPKDEKDAFNMLKKLSGKKHLVYTGFTVTDSNNLNSISDYEITKVKFTDLQDEEINSYIKSGEPLDKAGAYGIQELGSMFVEGIEGDYFNVVGLPIFKLCKVLKNNFGINLL